MFQGKKHQLNSFSWSACPFGFRVIDCRVTLLDVVDDKGNFIEIPASLVQPSE
jgi:hypothetical protein